MKTNPHKMRELDKGKQDEIAEDLERHQEEQREEQSGSRQNTVDETQHIPPEENPD